MAHTCVADFAVGAKAAKSCQVCILSPAVDLPSTGLQNQALDNVLIIYNGSVHSEGFRFWGP